MSGHLCLLIDNDVRALHGALARAIAASGSCPSQGDRSPATAAPGATPRRHRRADANGEPEVDSAQLRAISPPDGCFLSLQ